MRCLRCALDYPAETRYCDRCGRGLSRPPGTRTEADPIPSMQDSTYLYSTYAPPGGGAAGTAPSTAAPPHSVPTTRLARPGFALPGSTAPRTARLGVDTIAAEETAPLEPPLSGDDDLARDLSYDPRPAGHESHDEASRHGGAIGAYDDETADLLSNFTVRRANLGLAVKSVRRPTAASTRRLLLGPLPRRLATALALLLVLGAVGMLAVKRHAAYADDLQRARALASQQQYAASIAAYAMAAGEWPFNHDATQGRATAEAAEAAQRAQAIQAAGIAHALDAAEAVRSGIYQAKVRERLDAARQADLIPANAPTSP